MNKLNPSIKHHLFIGGFISLWIFSFAFFIHPFDDGTLYFPWTRISIGFSLIAFLCYAIVAILQKAIYQKCLKWSLGLEVTTLVFFHLLYLVATYSYYKSPVLHGLYTFFEFADLIIIKLSPILAPILILTRIYAIKLIPAKEDILTIKGENKLDILKVKQADLVCISNAQNYVEIFFLQGGELSSKIIRSSLKKMQENLDFLVQVHRSHLINPVHFKFWKNQHTIALTQIDIPVSKNYRDQVLSL